jgi:hypothetical protein
LLLRSRLLALILLVAAVLGTQPQDAAGQASPPVVTVFVGGFLSQCDGTESCSAVSGARPIWQALYGAGTSRPATFAVFSYSGNYGPNDLPIYSQADASTNAHLYSAGAAGPPGLADVVFPSLIASLISRYPQSSIDVVAYSLGGVVATEWAHWASTNKPSDLARVRTIVPMDGPVGGTNPAASQVACLSPSFAWLCTGVATDLRWDNGITASRLSWLASSTARPPVVCLESSDDYIVNGAGYPNLFNLAVGRGCWVGPSGQAGTLQPGFDAPSARFALGSGVTCLPSDGAPCFVEDILDRHARILQLDSFPAVKAKLVSILAPRRRHADTDTGTRADPGRNALRREGPRDQL